MKFGGFYTFDNDDDSTLVEDLDPFLKDVMELLKVSGINVISYNITDIIEDYDSKDVHFEVEIDDKNKFDDDSDMHFELENLFSCGLTIYDKEN